jgi:glycosyltransferase involved in cell wall biosynthesis
MNKKTIVMIVYSDYPTDTRVRREAEALSASNRYLVQVITLRNGAIPKRTLLEGVEIIEVNTLKYRGKNQLRYLLSYGNFFIKAMLECSRLTLKKELDAVHIHNMPDFLVFAALLPKLMGKLIILDIHDTMPETFGSKFGSTSRVANWLLRFEEYCSCLFADRLISVNDIQKDKILSRGINPGKITILMNVPDPKIFDVSRLISNNPNRQSDGFNLVYHGTIAHRLGVDLILDALHTLKDQIPNIKLHLWSRKEEAQTILGNQIRELHLEDRVMINDMIPAERLPQMLAPMDLGVIGNRVNMATELMLPVKMMEYMSLKIPVVAPRIKAIEHYFTDDMLMFYEPENVDSLAAAIRKLYGNEDLRKDKAEKAYQFLQTISWDKQKQDLLKIYQDL